MCCRAEGKDQRNDAEVVHRVELQSALIHGSTYAEGVRYFQPKVGAQRQPWD